MQFWTQKWTFWRLVVVIAVLVIFFIFDDVLMIYLMAELDFLSIHSGWYWVFYFAALITSLLLALVVFEAMRRQPTTGQEGLIGETGRVMRITDDGYQVKVLGEIWQADCEQRLKVKDPIIVKSMMGLRLKVERR